MRKLVFGLVLVSALTASAATLRSGGGSGGFLSAVISWIFGTPNIRCGWGDGTNNNCN